MAEKTIEQHLEDYRQAEAYDYPRGTATLEGFAKYLSSVLDLGITIERVKE